ncbi:MAG TPA: DUF3313 domain-containing protein [Planctomycetota bacterium]|nr:DUF3313 domain-containing protein [Planctomycetota bacterium]
MSGRNIVLGIALLAAACASKGPGPKSTSGFMSDYSELRHDEKYKSDWVYIKPDADLQEYDRVLIDPVVVMPLKASTAGELSPAAQQKIADHFTKILKDTIAPYYTLALAPGPNVLRVRIAITDVEKSTGGKPGDPDFRVGGAAMEAEIVDSVSGARLAAAIDRIQGSSAGRDVPREWLAVDGAMVEWANRLLDYLDYYNEK